MTTVGFFGCCGAARESQCLLGAVSKRFQGPGLHRKIIQKHTLCVISRKIFAVQDLKCLTCAFTGSSSISSHCAIAELPYIKKFHCLSCDICPGIIFCLFQSYHLSHISAIFTFASILQEI